jgi:hypothetical protein
MPCVPFAQVFHGVLVDVPLEVAAPVAFIPDQPLQGLERGDLLVVVDPADHALDERLVVQIPARVGARIGEQAFDLRILAVPVRTNSGRCSRA